MDSFWRVEDETVRRTWSATLPVQLGDAVTFAVACVLFGWWALLGAGVILGLAFSRQMLHHRRHPVQFAAKGVVIRGFEVASGRLGLPSWARPLSFISAPVRMVRSLFDGAPSVARFASPMHARVVGSTVYVYDDAAITAEACLPRWGHAPIRLDRLHALPHDEGIVTGDVDEAAADLPEIHPEHDPAG